MTFHATNLGLLPGGNDSTANGCSLDGGLVVGQAFNSGGHARPVYWDSLGAIHELATLSGTFLFDTANDVSDDGGVIFGLSQDGSGTSLPVMWVAPSYAISQLSLPGGASAGYVVACSRDGRTAVGVVGGIGSPSGEITNPLATVWVNGVPALLPTAPGFAAFTLGAAQECSPDGSIVSGYLFHPHVGVTADYIPVIWTGGPSWSANPLGTLPGGVAPVTAANNAAIGCATGGTVVVGYVADSGNNSFAAFWTSLALNTFAGPVGGAGSLAFGCTSDGALVCGTSASGGAAIWSSGAGSLLPAFSGALSVNAAVAISSDRSVIVGSGVDAGGHGTAVRWSSAAPTGAPLVWFRLNTGAWFPTGGDPATLTGGISLSVLLGQAFFATVQGTGDAGITLNAGASPFVGAAPPGFISGLPHSGGGFTTLDPGKQFGSASLSGGNLIAGFPSSPGMAQSVDGYSAGAYYFEIVSPTGDIFSADWGGGVGINFNGGGDFNQWFNNGRFSAGSANGGALVTGQSLVHELSSLGALGVSVQSDVFDFRGGGTAVGIALYISANPPPPPTLGKGFLICGNAWTIAQPQVEIYGLDHLIGQTVVGLADGVPVGPLVVDSGGRVVLPFPASYVTLGLSFTVQLQTPYLDTGNPTVQGRRKDLTAATVRVDASAAPMVGSNQPDGGSFTPTRVGPLWTNMQPAVTQDPQQFPATYTNPAGKTVVDLFSGDFRANLQPGWDTRGQIAVQQTLPLPLAITALMPEALIGDLPEQAISPPQGGGGEQGSQGPGLWMIGPRGRR